jgi:3-hydroxyacyl-CoA dehydrogenase/enoyl-CoA hydratase/3-hydroxybutyryl-CoA epimerase
MKDLNIESLRIGLKQSSDNFLKKLKKKRMSRDDFERKQRSIKAQLDYTGFKNVDLVIEAIVEDLEVKKSVFSELEKEISADCIVATNTSSLRVNDMACAFKHPERFVGLHFFNPVNKMPLVEIISHEKSSPEVLKAAHQWVLKVKKVPVIIKDGPGFLVNRVLIPYMNEASILLEEGVPLDQVEQACLNFGMPMGPARLLDEIGLDVADKVGKILYGYLGERVKPADLGNKLVELGPTGKKGRKGFYLYDEKGKQGEVNQQVLDLLPEKKKDMGEIEIQMRVFLPMINEASLILDEGLVSGPQDIDLSLIFGIGFPPFRGGLLRYADREGLDKIVDAMEGFARSVSSVRYKPSGYLEKLVSEGRKFYN